MIPLELLLLVSGSAVLPYIAEIAWDKVGKRHKHPLGANAPD